MMQQASERTFDFSPLESRISYLVSRILFFPSEIVTETAPRLNTTGKLSPSWSGRLSRFAADLLKRKGSLG